MSLRVALHIADERACRHLRTIISLASQRTAAIELVKSTDRGIHAPQVIVVCDGAADTEQLLQAASKPGAPRIVVYGPCQRDYPWILPSPATSESFQRLMQQVVLAPLARSHTETATNDQLYTPAAAAVNLLQPLQACDFLQAIAQARAENRVLELVADGAETFIYVDGANDRVYASDAFDLLDQRAYTDLFTMSGRRFHWLPQLPRTATALSSCSLEAVIWSLAYAQPLGKISNTALRLHFSLRRWPYFSEFRYSAEQLAWSAQLVRAPASLAQLVTGRPKLTEAVVRFYNACVYSGIAQASAADTERADSPADASGWRQLLAKVRASI